MPLNYVDGPNKQSPVFRQGTSPQTEVVISGKNRIFSYTSRPQNQPTTPGMYQVGVVSNFAPTQSRNADPVRGIGYGDQIAELVPGVMEPVTISVERAALYLAMMFQVFGYKSGMDGMVRALKHHKWPFDIRQEIVMSDIITAKHPESKAGCASTPFNMPYEEPRGCDSSFIDGYSNSQRSIVTFYEACWFTNLSATYAADTAIVSETADISCTDILSDSSAIYSEALNSGLIMSSTRWSKKSISSSSFNSQSGSIA